MPLRGDINIMEDTFRSSLALARWRVVQYSSTQGYVRYGTARQASLAGVTQNATSASGDTVRVRQLGKSLVTISDSVTIGVPLSLSDSEGRVSNVMTGTGDGIVGVPEETSSASGDQITCFLQIRRQ